jgi:acyl-coenzyme A thioesterase PaaI-like protein
MVTTVLDELGVRALWAKTLDETQFAVTTSLTTKYRKPVPYETDLVSVGRIVSETSRFIIVDTALYDTDGVLFANAELRYIKLASEVISTGVDVHDQMPYLIDDGVKELPFEFRI